MNEPAACQALPQKEPAEYYTLKENNMNATLDVEV
jgi:hypothetical protein